MEGRHQRRPGRPRPRRGCGNRPPRRCRSARPGAPGRSLHGIAAVGAVAHGLSVGADGDYIARRDAGCVEQAGGRVGIETRQRIGRAARASSSAPDWFSASSSARRAEGMSRLALASTAAAGRGPAGPARRRHRRRWCLTSGRYRVRERAGAAGGGRAGNRAGRRKRSCPRAQRLATLVSASGRVCWNSVSSWICCWYGATACLKARISAGSSVRATGRSTDSGSMGWLSTRNS